VIAAFGPASVELLRRPLAFRAPMLRSTLHPQWDAGFLRATTLQVCAAGCSTFLLFLG
jgi:hypothetical protein